MGVATTICSGKTGTLTQNKMTVVGFHMDGIDQGKDVQLIPELRNILAEAVAINPNVLIRNVIGQMTYQIIVLLLIFFWVNDVDVIPRTLRCISYRTSILKFIDVESIVQLNNLMILEGKRCF
jgi:hypothetical protein